MTNKIDIERDLPELPTDYDWELEVDRFNDEPDMAPDVVLSVIRHDVISVAGAKTAAGRTRGQDVKIATVFIDTKNFGMGHHADGALPAVIFQAILTGAKELVTKARIDQAEKAQNTERANKLRDALTALGL